MRPCCRNELAISELALIGVTSLATWDNKLTGSELVIIEAASSPSWEAVSSLSLSSPSWEVVSSLSSDSELTISELALVGGGELVGSELAPGGTTSYPARLSLVHCLSLSPLSSHSWGRHVHCGVLDPT